MTDVLNPTEIRSALEGLGERLNGLRSGERDDARNAEIRTVIRDIQENDILLTVAERTAETQRSAATGGQAGTAEVGTEVRSVGAQVTESEEYRTWASRGATGASSAIEVRSLLDSSSTAGSESGLFVPRGTPVLGNVRRQRLFIRDLISVVGTSLNSVPYIRELNPLANGAGAATVAEGAAKPEVSMQFQEYDATIRKIAAWIPMTTEILADATTLRGYVDGRLAYMLALAEEKQVLTGNGTAPNLAGILNTAGLQVLPSTDGAAADKAVALGKAIGLIEAVDGAADGIAMNPADYWAMVTSRHAQFLDAGLGSGAPFGSPAQAVWGVPVVRTPSLAVGKSVVGSWQLGATLLDREQTTIKVGDQHLDYFTNNKVVVLAEERVGLAVHRPDFFVEVDFA